MRRGEKSGVSGEVARGVRRKAGVARGTGSAGVGAGAVGVAAGAEEAGIGEFEYVLILQ